MIELLISVVIAVSLLGVVIVGYRHFLEGRVLSLAAAELKSQLRLVRTKAMSGEKPASDCGSLNGYRVREEAGGLVYLPVCDGSNYEEKKESLELNQQIEEIEIEGRDEFFFRALDGALDSDEVRIRLSYKTQEREVVISSSGEIE